MTAIPSRKAQREGDLYFDVNQLRKFPELFTRYQSETASGRDPYQVRDEIYKDHPEADYIYCVCHDLDHPDRIKHYTKSQSVNKLEVL